MWCHRTNLFRLRSLSLDQRFEIRCFSSIFCLTENNSNKSMSRIFCYRKINTYLLNRTRIAGLLGGSSPDWASRSQLDSRLLAEFGKVNIFFSSILIDTWHNLVMQPVPPSIRLGGHHFTNLVLLYWCTRCNAKKDRWVGRGTQKYNLKHQLSPNHRIQYYRIDINI